MTSTLPIWYQAFQKSPCPTFIIESNEEIPSIKYANEQGMHLIGHCERMDQLPLNTFFISESFQWGDVLTIDNFQMIAETPVFLFREQLLERVYVTVNHLMENVWIFYVQQSSVNKDYQRLRSFIEQNEEAVIDIDALGTCRVSNEAGWTLYKDDASLASICLESYKAHSSISPQKSFAFDHTYYSQEAKLQHLRVKFIPIFMEGKFDGGYIIAVDQSSQVSTRIQLAEKSMQYEQLWNSPYMPILRVDHEARIVRVNPAFEQLFGFTNEEVLGKLNPTIPQDADLELIRLSDQLSKGKSIGAHETYRMTKSGERIDVLAYFAPILNYRGQVLGAHVLYNNISESKAYQRELLKSQEKYRILSENAFDIISILDGNGRIQYVSPSVKEVGGYEEKILQNSSIYIFVHPDSQELLYQTIEGDWAFTKRKKLELMLLNAQNEYTWNEVSITPLEHEEDTIKFIFAIKNISKLKKMQEELNNMAFYDYLTGLPNRRLFDDRLKQEMTHSKRRNQGLAVLMIDGHGFKAINDQFGHDVGDEVIRMMAKRLESCIRESDTVARFGGDEMSIIVTDVTEQNQVDKIIQRILRAFSLPIEAGGYLLNVHLGIGIAIAPQDTCDVHELVRFADQALYRSKGKGASPTRTTWSYYHQIKKDNQS